MKSKPREEAGAKIIGFKLKKSEEEFQVTREGEFEFFKFEHRKVYSRVPAEDQQKFEAVEGGEEK